MRSRYVYEVGYQGIEEPVETRTSVLEGDMFEIQDQMEHIEEELNSQGLIIMSCEIKVLEA